ncbi:MAG: tripartite tricarboxylate transporter TctB family protein [Firmicutes bacterium]|jgi:predicted secreted protein|nr:tripartite tricarboxylate transporter TctB family protein [Bacillota bacterium]
MRSNTDRVGAILMLIVAVVFISQMGNLTYLGVVFPRAVLTILVVLSTILLVKSFVKPSPAKTFRFVDIRTAVAAAAIVVLWAILMSWLGFVVASILSFGVLMVMVDRSARDLKVFLPAILIAAIEILVFYYVFVNLLTVPLPRGILI